VKKFLLAILLVASLPSFADESPPSEASIRELMGVTDMNALLDQVWSQMDGMMEQAMREGLGDTKLNAEQDKILAEFRQEMVKLLKDEMGWDKLEPTYLELYSKTFSQSEVDGMIAFYKSDTGKAVLAKLPLLMQNITQVTVKLTQGLMPRLRTLVEDYVPKIKKAAT
jgi:uncharacterized protein